MYLLRAIGRFCKDEDGVGSIYMLCLLPVFLMLAGLGMDGTAAFRTRDMLQSTADAAALAGALQLPTGGPANTSQECGAVNNALTYTRANMSVAGFGNVLNTSYTSPSTCTPGDVVFGNWDGTTFTSPTPSGGNENAIKVTVKTATANGNAYPTSFLALVGKSSWDIAAAAVAVIGKPIPVCLLTNSNLSISGSASVNMSGCTIESKSDLTCNLSSSATQPDYGLAVGWDGPNGSHSNWCGSKGHFSHVPASSITEPPAYSSLATNIPSFSCTPSSTISWNTASVSAGNYCGNVQLQNNVTISGGTVVISNGSLDTNGHTLTVTNGTIVFTGDPTSTSYTHNIVDTSGGSTNPQITVTPPTSGTWSGVAFYQDPALTVGIDFPIRSSDKMPNLTFNGLIYTPNANWTYAGNMNGAGAGCLIIVAKTFSLVGTGTLLARSACPNAPVALLPISRLVQ
jgi:Flp pilus assembly protein TadG